MNVSPLFVCVWGGGEGGRGVLYLIVLVPDHCLSFYFLWPSGHNASVVTGQLYFGDSIWIVLSMLSYSVY